MREHPGKKGRCLLSVAEPLRHKGGLEVHVKAQALATYTSQILKNTNIFNPEVDKYLIKRIKKHAIKIYENAWAANKIRADTNNKNRKRRYKLQQKALSRCDKLHADIGIAKGVFHLRMKRMKYWSGLISEVRNLLQAWIESDVDRYGQP